MVRNHLDPKGDIRYQERRLQFERVLYEHRESQLPDFLARHGIIAHPQKRVAEGPPASSHDRSTIKSEL